MVNECAFTISTSVEYWSSVPNVCALFFIILLNNITDVSHIVSRVTLLAKSGIQEVI